PDRRLLAVEDTPGAIRLVRPEDRAEVARLEAPEQSRLIPGCFTPDGTRLITVGEDTRALHVWDLSALRRGLAELGLRGDALPHRGPPRPASRTRPFGGGCSEGKSPPAPRAGAPWRRSTCRSFTGRTAATSSSR